MALPGISRPEQTITSADRIRAVAEAARTSATATSIHDLLSRIASILHDNLGYEHVGIYLNDESLLNLELKHATGAHGARLRSENLTIPLDSDSPIAQVAANLQISVVNNIADDPSYPKHRLPPTARAEIILPIASSQIVFGVLTIQSAKVDAFDEETVALLETIADHVTRGVDTISGFSSGDESLDEAFKLYEASHRIAQSDTEDELYRAVADAIRHSVYVSAIFVAEPEGLRLTSVDDPEENDLSQVPELLPVLGEEIERYLATVIPLIVTNLNPPPSIPADLVRLTDQLNCEAIAFLPVMCNDRLAALIALGAPKKELLIQASLHPYANLAELIRATLEKLAAQKSTQQHMNELQTLNSISENIGQEVSLDKLYPTIHHHIRDVMGDLHFYIALYDPAFNHIEIPYVFEGGEPFSIDPIPLGEGLTSIVIRTRQPLMLVENTEARALALGAKIIGDSAKSWLGVPLIIANEAIGVMTIQDTELEHRFNDDDLRLFSTLAGQVASAIHSSRLIEETKRRALQLQTAAEISRETSGTLEMDKLLSNAVNLVRDRFNFYHASVFLLDPAGENAVVRESTGEAGQQLKDSGHRLKVGSRSIIGNVTETGKPLVVNDVTNDPTHRPNPLLPETKSELGIPLSIGERIIGALNVQSDRLFAFTPDDIEVLQILADQLAVAVTNAQLFEETQEHLAKHRLVHHVTTVSASSTSIEDALSSAVQGLRVTLGNRVAILLLDQETNTLKLTASAGYDEDILGLQVPVGEGITGWVAANREPLLINNVAEDPRYIAGDADVRAELAVPLVFRGELLGVLNVESDEVGAYGDHDQDMLATLAGSLSAILVNARLSERQRMLFEVTNKIRRSSNMQTILATTASEISRAVNARRAHIQLGGQSPAPQPIPDNGKETSE